MVPKYSVETAPCYFSRKGIYTSMYLYIGFLRLDLGICAQDLNKLGDEELKALQGMAAVFAGQAGDGAPGSRIAVEKRLVPQLRGAGSQ